MRAVSFALLLAAVGIHALEPEARGNPFTLALVLLAALVVALVEAGPALVAWGSKRRRPLAYGSKRRQGAGLVDAVSVVALVGSIALGLLLLAFSVEAPRPSTLAALATVALAFGPPALYGLLRLLDGPTRP